jgi:O-antigen ligase
VSFRFVDIRGVPLAALLACAATVTGVGIAMLPREPLPLTLSPALPLAFGPVLLVLCICGFAQMGRRAVATWCLYGAALGLALPSLRLSGWMTVSDLFLLLAAVLLFGDLVNLRLRSTVERGVVWAVTLIFTGGLLGVLATDDVRASLLNLVRLIVAAGATLLVFIAWGPSTRELRTFMALVVVSGVATSAWAFTHMNGYFYGRRTGLAEHPNHLALVCLIAVGPAIAFALTPDARRTSRLIAGGAVLLLVGAIVVSGSRAGVVGLVAATFTAAVLVRAIGSRVRLAVVAAAAVAIALVGFASVTPENAIQRAFAANAVVVASDVERRTAFDNMTDQIRSHPITGVGFSDPLAGHDAYLQLWAAGGLFALAGGILVVGATGAAARVSWRLPRPHKTDDPSWPLLAAIVSMSGLLVALAFQPVLWSRYIWVTAALLAASSAVAVGPRRPDRSETWAQR